MVSVMVADTPRTDVDVIAMSRALNGGRVRWTSATSGYVALVPRSVHTVSVREWKYSAIALCVQYLRQNARRVNQAGHYVMVERQGDRVRLFVVAAVTENEAWLSHHIEGVEAWRVA